MKLYKINIPGSWFFWWLLCGIFVSMLTILAIMPWYKIFSFDSVWSSSGDVMSLDDSQATIKELYDLISMQYYDTGAIDQSIMLNYAVAAFVNALGDPFSSYLPPSEGQEFQKAIDGNDSLDGIGAVLSKKNDGALVEEVLKWSPAAQSDIRPLDLILKVNGSGVQQLSIGEIVQQIRGVRGTTVELTIGRVGISGSVDVIEKSITRDTILIPSVSSKLFSLGTKKIGYIALSLFAQDTDEKLQIEIDSLKKEWISWLILDVRGNGGGLLPESVDVASHFLPLGTDVVNVKYRLYTDATYKSEWNDTLSSLPLVILTDAFTASASEIITLAIKEWRCKGAVSGTGLLPSIWFDSSCNVLIVGEKTFGKGSVQNLQELHNWWSLKLTVGKWFSPSGISIDHVGIVPDIVVPFDKELYQKNSTDLQLEKAKWLLSQKI